MTRLPQTPISTDSFYSILGNRPEIFQAWSKLDAVLLLDSSSTLSTELKEEVRADLAQGIGCRYCASVGGSLSDRPVDPRASLASAFAEQVITNRGEIDDAVFSVLREEFTTNEIVELCAWICFKFGANVLGALMQLEPATADQTAGYLDLLKSGTEHSHGGMR